MNAMAMAMLRAGLIKETDIREPDTKQIKKILNKKSSDNKKDTDQEKVNTATAN
jgi:hypothetical protein